MDNEIIAWLMNYDRITEVAEMIHNEELPKETDTIALQRSGVENLGTEYVGEKGWRRRYQYVLFLKGESESDLQRLANLDWLDDLSNWIDKQNQLRNFPNLEEKEVKNVSCDNAVTFETDEENGTSKYYLQLYFIIKGGN